MNCPICNRPLKCIDEAANWHYCKACDKAWNFNYAPPALYYEGKKATHGIDCACAECEKIRKMLKNKTRSRVIFLSGTEEDKKKIMGAG